MHLFNKENIWSNPCSPLHTFNHPDKYKNNNSVNRIISKERREKRYKERYFKNLIPTRIQECFQCFYMQSSSLQINSTYRINSTTRNSKEIQQLQGSFRTGSLPAVPPVHPSILHSRIKFLGSYSTSRLPVILPGRNSILHGSQPSRSPSSDSQVQPT